MYKTSSLNQIASYSRSYRRNAVSQMARAYFTPAYNRYAPDKNHARSETTLKQTLLHPEAHAPRQSLIPWAYELKNILQSINQVRHKAHAAERIADIYNQAAWLMFSSGDVHAARELCYSQIQLFIAWRHRMRQAGLLKYVFQPWINLCRFDRYTGQTDDALKKITTLQCQQYDEIVIGSNTLLTHELQKLLRNDADLHAAVDHAVSLEPIKACLAAGRYDDVLTFAALGHQNPSLQSAIYEAQIIALVNGGNRRDAEALLVYAENQATPDLKPIFYLRRCEMDSQLMFDEWRMDVQLLLDWSVERLAAPHIRIDDIQFVLHAVHVIRQMEMTNEALKFLYFCLEASIQMNDEILKAECLIGLYDLIERVEGRKLIENLMIEHYHHTQYSYAKSRLLSCFPDLRYVEGGQNGSLMASLVDDLLIFSASVTD